MVNKDEYKLGRTVSKEVVLRLNERKCLPLLLVNDHRDIYSVRRKKTPLNKYNYFQYISIFFYDIFRGYSGHNLPLLLRFLSSQLLLLSSSTSLNIKDFFSTAHTNNPDYNQLSGILKHKIRLKCRKNTTC